MIVCGGRDFKDSGHVWDALNSIHEVTPITELMQGGAAGVDRFAEHWAASKRIKWFVCLADWKTYKQAAGPIRNAQMLEWKPDVVIAFPGGVGTQNMVLQARAAGVRVIRVPAPERPKILSQGE